MANLSCIYSGSDGITLVSTIGNTIIIKSSQILQILASQPDGLESARQRAAINTILQMLAEGVGPENFDPSLAVLEVDWTTGSASLQVG